MPPLSPPPPSAGRRRASPRLALSSRFQDRRFSFTLGKIRDTKIGAPVTVVFCYALSGMLICTKTKQQKMCASVVVSTCSSSAGDGAGGDERRPRTRANPARCKGECNPPKNQRTRVTGEVQQGP
jgi:hypothetical protein